MNSRFTKEDDFDWAGPFKTKLYKPGLISRFKVLLYLSLISIKLEYVGESIVDIIIIKQVKEKNNIANKYMKIFSESINSSFKQGALLYKEQFSFSAALKILYSTMLEYVILKVNCKKICFLDILMKHSFLMKINKLDKLLMSLSSQNVVTFCDAIGFDNLVTQYATFRKWKTMTLQHGQYRLLNDENMSADIEAIKNFKSDIMFCWGEATIKEFQKVNINRSRFASTGLLLDPEQRQIWKSKSKEFRNNSFQVFGLPLSGDNNYKSNVSLIEFAINIQNTYKIKCVLRPHPKSQLDKYEALKELDYTTTSTKDEFFDLVDFVVLATTGFFIECFYRGCKFIFFDSGDLPDPFKMKGLCVSNVSEIRYIVSNYESIIHLSNFYSLYDDFKYQNKRINNEIIKNII